MIANNYSMQNQGVFDPRFALDFAWKFSNVILLGVVFLLIGLVGAGTTFSGSTNSVQYYSPSLEDIYSTSEIETYWGGLSFDSEEDCNAVTDFVVGVVPTGCSPVIVTSDLLEEQDVPVYCQLYAVQVNPLIDVATIDSISFSGDYPDGVKGVSFYPAQAAVSSQTDLSGMPITSNIGYVVIVLEQNKVEDNMSDYITGNLTAKISYDSDSVYGTGAAKYYLSEGDAVSDNSFWNGEGFLRLRESDGDSATIEIYDEKDDIYRTVTLDSGESSSTIYFPDYYCRAGFKVTLVDVVSAEDSALLDIDGDDVWVRKGSSFLNSNCNVKSLSVNADGSGTIDISCSGSSFTLKLKSNEDGGLVDEAKSDEILKPFGLATDTVEELVELYRSEENDFGKKYGEVALFDQIELAGSAHQYATQKSLCELFIEKYPVSDMLNTVEGILNKIGSYDVSESAENVYVGNDYHVISVEKFRDVDDASYVDFTYDGVKYSGMKVGSKTSDGDDYVLVDSISSSSVKFSVYVKKESKGSVSLKEGGSGKLNEKSIVVDDIKVGGSKSVDFVYSGTSCKDQNKGDTCAYDGSSNYVKVEDVDAGEAKFSVYVDGSKKGSSVTVKDGAYGSLNGKDIKVTNVEVIESAEVSLTLVVDKEYTESNFSFGVGIEKRLIDLSPERTEEMIANLNDTIADWTEVNEKLGSLIKGLKGACYATSAVLMIKNFVNGVSGEATARKSVMAQIKKRCSTEAAYRDMSTTECYNALSDEIDVAVKGLADELEDVNERMDAILERYSSGGTITDREGYLAALKSELGGWSYTSGDITLKASDLTSSDQVAAALLVEELAAAGVTGTALTAAKADLDSELSGAVKLSKATSAKDAATSSAQNSLGQTFDTQSYTSSSATEMTWSRNTINAVAAAKINEANGVSGSSELSAGSGSSEEEECESGCKNGGYSSYLYDPGYYSDYLDAKCYSVNDKECCCLGESSSSSIEAGDKVQHVAYNGVNYLLKLSGSESGDMGVEAVYKEESGKYIKQSYDGKSSKNPFDGWVYTVSEDDTCSHVWSKGDAKVSYYESGSAKGMPAFVPFDVKEGWYATISSDAYSDSGDFSRFYICNVGADAVSGTSDDVRQSFVVNTASSIDSIGGCTGVSKERVAELYEEASAAIAQARKQYGNSAVEVNGEKFEVGAVASTSTSYECQDFMSPDDCLWLFNVCDPVICSSSRCNLGGKLTVSNVVSSGLLGSILLCLPNYEEGIKIPVCLTGIHAGIEGWISILESERECLQTSLETGENVGICDAVTSVYICEFFWNQFSSFIDKGLDALFSSYFVVGNEAVRGGGEYLLVSEAWESTSNAASYFVSSYAANAFAAFKIKSVASAGTEVCEAYIGATVPTSADLFDSLLEPESPTQFYAYFTSSVYTEATSPVTDQYKVYYHIYAGEDSGVQYKVYLTDPPASSYYVNHQTIDIDSGYISAGESVDSTEDFTAPQGYKQLCVDINGDVECGFGTVSTSLAVNYSSALYVADVAYESDIDSEDECISGTGSAYSLIGSLNLQSNVEDYLDGDISLDGIVRVCATDNPGNSIGESSRWVEVGSCSDDMACYLDSTSVKSALELVAAVEGDESVLDILGDVGTAVDGTGSLSSSDIVKLLSNLASEVEVFTKVQLRAYESDVDVIRVLTNLSWVGGVGDYTGQGSNANRAYAYLLRALVYQKVVGVLLEDEEDKVDVCAQKCAALSRDYSNSLTMNDKDECEADYDGEFIEKVVDGTTGCCCYDLVVEEYEEDAVSSDSGVSSVSSGSSVSSLTNCQEEVGARVLEVAKEIKSEYSGIDDSVIEAETGYKSFECLALGVAMTESGLTHCDASETDACIECGDSGDLSKSLTGNDERYGVMQVDFEDSGGISVDDISVNVGYVAKKLISNYFHYKDMVYYYTKEDYTGWKASLRAYDGVGSDSSDSYVADVLGWADFVGENFEGCGDGTFGSSVDFPDSVEERIVYVLEHDGDCADSACVINKNNAYCAEYITKLFDYIFIGKATSLGVYGDAWEFPANIKKAGGSRIHDYETDGVFSDYDSLQVGDVLGIYVSTSDYHADAQAAGEECTHVMLYLGKNEAGEHVVAHRTSNKAGTSGVLADLENYISSSSGVRRIQVVLRTDLEGVYGSVESYDSVESSSDIELVKITYEDNGDLVATYNWDSVGNKVAVGYANGDEDDMNADTLLIHELISGKDSWDDVLAAAKTYDLVEDSHSIVVQFYDGNGNEVDSDGKVVSGEVEDKEVEVGLVKADEGVAVVLVKYNGFITDYYIRYGWKDGLVWQTWKKTFVIRTPLGDGCGEWTNEISCIAKLDIETGSTSALHDNVKNLGSWEDVVKYFKNYGESNEVVTFWNSDMDSEIKVEVGSEEKSDVDCSGSLSSFLGEVETDIEDNGLESWLEASVVAKDGDCVVKVSNSLPILFGSGDYALAVEYSNFLKKIVVFVDDYSGVSFELTGYYDGDEDAGLSLSRVQEVYSNLTGHGLSGDVSVSVVDGGVGSFSSNTFNRRVDMKFFVSEKEDVDDFGYVIVTSESLDNADSDDARCYSNCNGLFYSVGEINHVFVKSAIVDSVSVCDKLNGEMISGIKPEWHSDDESCCCIRDKTFEEEEELCKNYCQRMGGFPSLDEGGYYNSWKYSIDSQKSCDGLSNGLKNMYSDNYLCCCWNYVSE